MGESNVLNFTEASQSTSAIPNTSRRRLDTPHGEKIHRSNTSIAMRKRGFQEDKGNENENDKIETESSHTISSVDYEWKGSRKKLVMQYFLAICHFIPCWEDFRIRYCFSCSLSILLFFSLKSSQFPVSF